MKKFSIIFFLPLFVFSCQSFDIVKRPKVSIEKFDLEYQFFLDGNQLIAGETENIKNTANESTIKISNNFKSSELSKNILNIFSRKHSAFSLKGFTILKLPDYVTKNSVKLTFDEKGLVQLQ